jgi:Domain of unknown function (DUF1871)
MMTKMEYEKAIEIVRSVVNQWDPLDLLATGAPIDEFENEIAEVVREIPNIKSTIDGTNTLSWIFSSAFDENFTPEECSDVGTKLYHKLCEAGLIK